MKAHYTGNSDQPLKIDYKIQDECVDLGLKDASDIGGDTFEDAAMKIGVSTSDRHWLTNESTVWNPWFKNANNDENKIIDLVNLPSPSFWVFYDDTHGDDVVQGTKARDSRRRGERAAEVGRVGAGAAAVEPGARSRGSRYFFFFASSSA